MFGLREAVVSDTPRTDAVIAASAGCDTYQQTVKKLAVNLERHAMQLERELNAALIVAGVASLERGEWAAERDGLNQCIREWRDICEKQDREQS